MILQLLLINLIVVLVHLSGFWDNLDDWVSKKFPLHHLPHIFVCGLCQCWWLSLLYCILTGNLTLLGITLSLVNAHLTAVTLPLSNLIINWLLKLIQWMMPR